MIIRGSVVPEEKGKYNVIGQWCRCIKADEFIQITLSPTDNLHLHISCGWC